jgi:hypothetical protein
MTDVARITKHARYLGTTTGSAEDDSGLGDRTGEPRRTEVAEVGRPTRLSTAAGVLVAQGVERVCTGSWEGTAEVDPRSQVGRRATVTG